MYIEKLFYTYLARLGGAFDADFKESVTKELAEVEAQLEKELVGHEGYIERRDEAGNWIGGTYGFIPNDPMDGEEITIRLENETTQKFNSWLEDCFQKLNKLYSKRARESGVVYKFDNPEINGEETSSYILASYNIGRRIERGIRLKWVEVGTRLKVRITFPSDSKILHPILDILIDLHNDFPDTREAVMDKLRELKSKYQIDDSVLPLDAMQVDAAKTEKKVVSKYDELCIQWVTRPYIPHQNKDEFLTDNAPELNSKAFDRILQDAYEREIIERGPGKHGRYKPKTVS